jgi:hypothetical protein
VPVPVEEAFHEPSAVSGRLSLIVAVVGVTCGLWLWNRYAIFPSTAMLHTAVGATLLLADVWLLVRYAIDEHKWPTLARFRLKKVGRLLPYDDLEDEDEYEVGNESEFAYLADSLPGSLLGVGSPSPIDAEEAGGTIAPSFPGHQTANRMDLHLLPNHRDAANLMSPLFSQQPPASASYCSEPVSKSPSFVRVAAGCSGSIDAESYYASLREQTSLIHPAADATVLLRPAATPHSRPQAYLERGDERPPRRIALSRSPFVIGRNGEHTEYSLETPDVSRQHVEIIEENGGYAAKDLGSTNGTLWNGERMIPFRVYPLQEGDCLTVAHVELSFRFVANARKTV